MDPEPEVIVISNDEEEEQEVIMISSDDECYSDQEDMSDSDKEDEE